MAKRKTLKSVVHSFADSFISTLNWWENDYVMGHILTAARETGKTTLDVDLLSGHIEPEEFLRVPIVGSIAYRCADFPRLVERSGSDPNFVTAAHMSIEFGIATEEAVAHAPHLKQSPFVCTVSLTDDRGRTYEPVRKDWWYPEDVYKVVRKPLRRSHQERRRDWSSRLVRLLKRSR